MDAQMNVYKFCYEGDVLEGIIIVIAKDYESAEGTAKSEISKFGFKWDTLKLFSVSEVENGIIVYNYKGEY